ncbi:MAG: tRNA lysidine(34) synthetase TilS [Verrucomicrobiota bacterium]|nr:tRNA lysidine(34) synthetase TilS [Verrucomicrobiota bacterium]
MLVSSTKFNWQEAVHTLSKCVTRYGFEPSAISHLRSAKNVLIACSGGADSVYLLCALIAQEEALGLRLHVAHYNHRWRGVESAADADFVESIAQTFELPYMSGIRSENEVTFNETNARELRLQFLRDSALKLNCDFLIFGHHLDDIIETQLQRISRGCSSDGLAAPRPVMAFEGLPTHVRPLLHLRAKDIRTALKAASIPWREDSSNEDVSIARNALRKKILPDIANSLNRDPAIGAARSRVLLEEDAVALDIISRQKLPDAYKHAPVLQRAALCALPTALMRRALTHWLSGHGLIGSVGASSMDKLIHTLTGSKKNHRLSAGLYYIVIDANTISYERADTYLRSEVLVPTILELGEQVILSSGATIQAKMVEICPDLRSHVESGKVDSTKEAILANQGESSLNVRSWHEGDSFFPLGAPGKKKLKDWFIDRKIPKPLRNTLPIFINNFGEVLWVPGFAPAESCRVRLSTNWALRLTYQARNSL